MGPAAGSLGACPWSARLRPAAGLGSAFLSLEFDRDLLDELNAISSEGLVWTGVMKVIMQAPRLEPSTLGLLGLGLVALGTARRRRAA